MSRGSERKRGLKRADAVRQLTAPPNALGRRCQATTTDGRPCPATPGEDDLCYWHSPRFSEAEKELARVRGGMASRPSAIPDAPMVKLDNPRQATALLAETATQVRRGELGPVVGNSLAYIVSVALRSFELDVLRRLEELERAMRGRPLTVEARR